MYVNTPTAKTYYSVSSDTLRRWAKAGKISFILTKGGHRRYFVPNSVSQSVKIPKFKQPSEQSKEFKVPKNICSNKIIYARVSSHKQKSDLQHQIQYLIRKIFRSHNRF